ncbi:MAG: MBL fold metallo-hydrolase [Fusobacteriaceae bacterium]
MEMKVFGLGIYMTNCYLVWDNKKEGYFFDCGGADLDEVKIFIEKNKIELKYLILTHGHHDHISGINKFLELYPKTILYIGEEEKIFLTDSKYNLSSKIGNLDFKYTGEYKTINEGDTVGNFKVISSPGHTIGSKCFYNEEEKILISGDTLFRRSFGRSDLPSGSEISLFKSLQKLCDTLPLDTVVYSGHTQATTIGEEKIFLKNQGFIK